MENNLVQKSKRALSKGFKILLIILVVILIGVFSFYYWGVYERGVLAGKVLRVAEKGVVFKTWEGKLNLETFGALKGPSPLAETFDFSVERSDDEVITDLKTVALTGERVNLHFIKRYTIFPWRGDTRYYVTQVERLNE